MEGPGIRTIVDKLSPLVGKTIVSVDGKSRFPLERVIGRAVTRIYPIGKLLFLEVPPCTFRVHFLMWGRYRLNGEIPGKVPRLCITLDDGSTLRFYASAIALLGRDEVKRLSDSTLDPMDGSWDTERATRLVRGKGLEWICDSLMDQAILPGVGNVIKNEALFTARVHPASPSGCIPQGILRDLLEAVRDFSFTWYRCDRARRKIHPFLKIYRKKTCPECGGRVESGGIGSLERISFWCPACQEKYTAEGS
jgi:endonuclease-8